MFGRLIGNAQAKVALEGMYQGETLPPVLLFAGPDGVGKGECALALARALLRTQKAAPPDLHVYRPEGKMELHQVESMRALLAAASVRPFEAPCSVFIIHEAEQMWPHSSNALLKTLEEPLPNTYFILLSSQPKALLPTILSRCRVVSFSSVPVEEVTALLTSKGIGPEEAARCAACARGSVARALELAEEGAEGSVRSALVALLARPDDSQLFEGCSKLGDAPHPERLLEQILWWYRDLHALASGCDPSLLYFKDALPQLLKRQGRSVPSLEEAAAVLDECRLALKRNVAPRNAFKYALLAL
jgi:DNA polymerase-3 subunit delta'